MKPTICPTCNLARRGFWETEYEMPCSECREKTGREDTENRLRKAVQSGKIKPNQLTPLGLKVCGLASL